MRRAQLYLHRTAISAERSRRLIAPHLRFDHGFRVLQGEENKVLLYRIRLADSLEVVLSNGQSRNIEGDCLVGGGIVAYLHLIYIVTNAPFKVCSGRIFKREHDAFQTIFLYLLRQIAHQSCGFATQRQTDASLSALSSEVGNGCRHFERIETRFRSALRQLHRNPNLESAFGIGRVRRRENLLRLYASAIPRPPKGRPPLHRIAHFSPLDRHAGISLSMGNDFHRVACRIFLVHLGEGNLECRTFIFFYTEPNIARISITAANAKLTCELTCRQRKLGMCLSESICCHLFLLYHLIVGIIKFELKSSIGLSFSFQIRTFIEHDGSHLHRLSRPIDAPIGVKERRCAPFVGRIKAITGLVTTLFESLVGRRIDVDLTGFSFRTTVHHFPVFTAGQRFDLGFLAVIVVSFESHLRIRHGMSRCSVYHHHANLFSWLFFKQRKHIAHIQQTAYRLHLWVVGSKFKQINTHGKCRHSHRVVGELILGPAVIAAHTSSFRHRLHTLSQGSIHFTVVRIALIIARERQSPHMERDGTNVSHLVQRHIESLFWDDRRAHFGRERRIGQSPINIA